MKNQKQEIDFLNTLGEKAVNTVYKNLQTYTKNALYLSKEKLKVIDEEYKLLKHDYFWALGFSEELAKKAMDGKNKNTKRLAANNPAMNQYRKDALDVVPVAARAWVLDGLIFLNQIGGVKFLAGIKGLESGVIDVLNSASSLCLGSANPWLIKADRLEDNLGLKDNICSAYHLGVRQTFALKELSKLYPSSKKRTDLTVHSESSGTIVDSIAVETCVAYSEKNKLAKKGARVLAIDGTWAGGYGSAREGTGFGIDGQQVDRAGKQLWMERSLPAPTVEDGKKFLELLEKKLKTGEVAALYLEPDIVGDLGLIMTDKKVLEKALVIMKKKKLPIILDCVQQLGRTGSYWGEFVDSVFKDYPYLVMTTAKSSSNGQPFGFVIMPRVISDCAYPLTQITTNMMNGPLLRALVVAEILKDKSFQSWVAKKGKDVERVAKEYGMKMGNNGVRGKFLNRGIYVGDNEQVKLAQLALLIEDGLLVGATPESLRYQPMLFETSATNEMIAHIICRRVKKVLAGEVSKEVKDAFSKMSGASGLARKNK